MLIEDTQSQFLELWSHTSSPGPHPSAGILAFWSDGMCDRSAGCDDPLSAVVGGAVFRLAGLEPEAWLRLPKGAGATQAAANCLGPDSYHGSTRICGWMRALSVGRS